jgi:hypothetical protein
MIGRRRAAILWGLAVASAIALGGLLLWLLAFQGDGGGDDENPTPTGVPRTTCKPAEEVIAATPADLPAGMAQYTSPERGYSVRYPSDWSAQPNTIAVQNMAGDAFFTTGTATQVKPNLAVACETIPIGTTSQQFVDAKLEVLQQVLGQRPEIEDTLTVNGREASQVSYSIEKVQTPEPLKVQKIEVFFADDLGGWTIALTVPQGEIDTYLAVFEAFVQSFRGA